MVGFSLNIKTRCLYVTWEIQDQIWAKHFCIPKNMHSRTPMVRPAKVTTFLWHPTIVADNLSKRLLSF